MPDGFLQCDHLVVDLTRIFWFCKTHHLNLIELMSTKDSFHIFSIGSRFTTETSRISDVPHCTLHVDNFPAVIARKRHFASSDEEEIIFSRIHFVDLRTIRRKESSSIHSRFANKIWRDNWHKSFCYHLIHHILHDSKLKKDEISLEIPKTRARYLRSFFDIDPSPSFTDLIMCPHRKIELAWSAKSRFNHISTLI